METRPEVSCRSEKSKASDPLPAAPIIGHKSLK
jgi:hypothetical protein